MNIKELKDKLTPKLEKAVVSARILLDKMRVIDEASRMTAAYTDPTYAPFYYHLGTLASPRTMLEVGFRLGLLSGCFLRGCRSVEKFLAFQERTDSFYSERLGRGNIRDAFKKQLDIHVGKTADEEFLTKLAADKWDLAIINEEVGYDQHMSYLDLIWPHVSLDGLVVMDYVVRHQPAKQAFHDFCKAKNREPVEMPTRYGVGIIQK